MSNELKALMEEYIKLLEQEVGSHTAFLFVHGQKPDSLRVSEGHRLRKAIEIENSRSTEPNLVHTNEPMHKILPILVKDDNGNEFLLKNFQQVLDMMEEIEQLKSNPEYSYEAQDDLQRPIRVKGW